MISLKNKLERFQLIALLLYVETRLQRSGNQLRPQEFLEKYQSNRLGQIPRYLKALMIRAQRGSVNLQKDAKKEAQLGPFERGFKEMCESMSAHASTEKRTAVEEFGWMIEEFKVSLFAQELGTPFPISAKRLNKKMDAIERMI